MIGDTVTRTLDAEALEWIADRATKIRAQWSHDFSHKYQQTESIILAYEELHAAQLAQEPE